MSCYVTWKTKHLRYSVLQNIITSHLNLCNYTLGAFYSIRYFKMGGTCIYVQNNLNILNIKLDNLCCDKDIEACAMLILPALKYVF
jgi:hypothetical protein